MATYIMNDSLPNWTDFAQVIIGTLGILATVVTLWKLMSRDKDREKEIANLSSIAKELRDMTKLNEKRYVESKKPQIEAQFFEEEHSGDLYLRVKNINAFSRMTAYKVISPTSPNPRNYPITTHGANQEFSLMLKFKNQSAFFKVEYEMDGVYKYTQEIQVWNNEIYQLPDYGKSLGIIESCE